MRRRGLSDITGVRFLACAAILVAAGGGGLAAGFTVRPSVVPDAPVAVAEMSPSETVGLRFPADWAEPESEAAPRTLAFASTLSKEIREDLKEKNKSDAAKLVGKLVAEKARAGGVSKVVFDRNGFPYHGRIAAVAEAAREAGLEF